MPAKEPRKETAALFVRLPVEQAEKLARAAFELNIPKQQLVNALVERYVDPRSTHSLARLPGVGAAAAEERRRVIVESEPDALAVGRHSFRPNEPSEVLSLADVADLLQVSESAVAERADAGELPGRKIGGEWRFSRKAVLAWLGAPAPEAPGDG